MYFMYECRTWKVLYRTLSPWRHGNGIPAFRRETDINGKSDRSSIKLIFAR